LNKYIVASTAGLQQKDQSEFFHLENFLKAVLKTQALKLKIRMLKK
jgi:hypothetical protein